MFDFDLSNGYVVLRIVCGLFLLPHAIGKFTAQEASFGFFRAAGFKPAPAYAYMSMLIEVVLGPLLILGIFTKLAAWACCIYLLIAAGAVIKVEKKWLWHIRGCEYPVFWAIACGIVALHG